MMPRLLRVSTKALGVESFQVALVPDNREETMAEISASIEIEQPLSTVFAFVSDLTNLPKWQDQVLDVQRGDEDPAPGVKYTQTVEMRGRKTETKGKFIAYEPDKVITVTNDGGPMKSTISYLFEGDDAKTTLTMERSIEVSGPLKLIAGMINKGAKKAAPEQLSALKKLLEGA